MKNSKLPGFTILEVVIVMLLVSVVVGMVYTVFHMIKSYEAKMTFQNQEQSKFLLANTAFNQDIDKAKYLKMGQDSSLWCINEQEEVYYQVKDSLFIRNKTGYSDTLLKAPRLKLSFTFIENKNHPELVEGVVLQLTDTLGRNTYISGHKNYSSTTLFNIPSNAAN